MPQSEQSLHLVLPVSEKKIEYSTTILKFCDLMNRDRLPFLVVTAFHTTHYS
jgi:hypothetical protein